MKYRQDLQVALRNRYARLIQTEFRSYEDEVRIVREWLLGQPALRSIVEAMPADLEPTYEVWLQECVQVRRLWWPGGEDVRARLVWELMSRIALGEVDLSRTGLMILHKSNYNELVRALTQSVLQHFFDYLGERLGSESEMLHHLERYKRQLEWFDRQSLYDKYLANKQEGERTYDTHLREFLFSQGVDYPFTQSRGPSGDTDVLAQLDGDDPLVCEVKLFDGADKGKRAVAGGLNQVIQYAQDYGKSIAYLVVVNISGRDVQLYSDEDEKVWPPRIVASDVTVYLVSVRALPPTVSASKMGKSKPVVFTRADLVEG